MNKCNFLVVLAILVATTTQVTANIKCTARGSGLAGGSTSTNNSFTLFLVGDTSTVYNGYGHNISVWLSTKRSNLALDTRLYYTPPYIVDNGDGSYTITYGIMVYGTFHLHVELFGIETYNSPFVAEFVGPYPCGDCNLHGLCHTNGSCICDPGYAMDNCTLALGSSCYKSQISQYGTSLYLYFMPEVNTSSSTTICSGIFSMNTLSLLGSNPLCVWEDTTTLNVIFGNNAALLPGHMVEIHSPSITPSVVIVEAPLNTPVAPVVIISAPAVHNPCADLVLDATSSYNSGGRPMTYVWSVSSSNSEKIGVIKNFLGTVTSSMLIIPFKYTAQVGSGLDLIFTLNISNYLGVSSVASTLVRFAGVQTLDVRVQPAVISVAAGRPVDVAGLVSFPSGECAGLQAPKIINYSWVRKSGPVLELGASTNTHILHINDGLLVTGQTYEFELVVTSGISSGMAIAVVHVTDADFSIHVLGGNRIFPFGVDLSLQAEILLNGNNASTGKVVWSIIDVKGKNIIVKDLESLGSVIIPAAFFYPGVFRVTGSLFSPSGLNVASDEVEIRISEALDIPIVYIMAPAIISAGERLVLSAVVDDPLQEYYYNWVSAQMVTKTSEDLAIQYNSRVLVVPGAFGSTMTFSVFVTSTRTQQVGWAQVEVIVRNSLRSGTCNLASAGIAFMDTFTPVCQGWEAIASPVTVRAWRLLGNSSKLPLQLAFYPIGTTNFVLPAGSHTLMINVKDSTGNIVSILQNTTVSLSTNDQSTLAQNPMLLINSLLAELKVDSNNYELQMQMLPGITDILNLASAKGLSTYSQRVLARETVCNISLALLHTGDQGLVSYVLSEIGVYPSEISFAGLTQIRNYVKEMATPNFFLEPTSLQFHLGVVYAYIVGELASRAVPIPVATNALHAISKASLADMFPSQDPYFISHNGLQLYVAKGETSGTWQVGGVTVNTPQNSWELSVVILPLNIYADTRVSTAVYEISYNHPTYAEVVLPTTAVSNGSVIECNVWNATTLRWSNDCLLMNTSLVNVVCRCALSAPTTIVSAFVYQSSDTSKENVNGGSLLSVKFGMLTGNQWAIIIGVGMFAIVALIGAVALAGKHTRHTGSFIRLRSYDEWGIDIEDVTVEDISTIDDDLSDPGSVYTEDSTLSEEDETLSEAEELGKAPNSTRLSRMGVQEGATGYVVSSTTLRNTVETDYDLERKENVGPITGTALRIRAQSVDMTQNTTGSPQPNPPNFNTASRFSLTAARAKLSAPSISRSALGVTRGDSLRAIPTTWMPPVGPNAT